MPRQRHEIASRIGLRHLAGAAKSHQGEQTTRLGRLREKVADELTQINGFLPQIGDARLCAIDRINAKSERAVYALKHLLQSRSQFARLRYFET